MFCIKTIKTKNANTSCNNNIWIKHLKLWHENLNITSFLKQILHHIMETINLSKLISWLNHNKLISDSILYFELIQGLAIKLFVSRREEKLDTVVSTVFRFHQLQVYIHRTCCRVQKNKHPKYEREVRYIFLF